MFKKIVINICVLLVLFFMLMFDKYMFNLNIFGINITIYYLIILFVGTYLDTPNGIIILSIITLIQEMTIGTNIGMITISTIISFLILKKVNKILYEENVINITLKNICVYISYMCGKYIIYGNSIDYVNITKIMLKEMLFLSIILISIYPLLKIVGTYIGKEYKKKNIITKYF